MAQPVSTSDVREAKLFHNNRSQAACIPAEFEFSGSRALIHKEGDELIIGPEPRVNLVDILNGISPLGPEDDFPNDLDATLLPLKDIDL